MPEPELEEGVALPPWPGVAVSKRKHGQRAAAAAAKQGAASAAGIAPLVPSSGVSSSASSAGSCHSTAKPVKRAAPLAKEPKAPKEPKRQKGEDQNGRKSAASQAPKSPGQSNQTTLSAISALQARILALEEQLAEPALPPPSASSSHALSTISANPPRSSSANPPSPSAAPAWRLAPLSDGALSRATALSHVRKAVEALRYAIAEGDGGPQPSSAVKVRLGLTRRVVGV